MTTPKNDSSPNRTEGINWKRWMGLIGILLVGFILTSCADAISFTEAAAREPVGFWYGLWHGIISPIAFIVSLFDSDVAIYAIYNNGAWYDFGYVLGVGVLMGGSKKS